MGVIDTIAIEHVSDLNVVRITADTRQNATYTMDKSGKELVMTLLPKEGTDELVTAAEDDLIPYEETRDELERLLVGAPPPTYSDAPFETGYDTSTGDSGLSPGVFLMAPMPPPGPGGRATVIGDVFYRTISDGMQIMILANGNIDSYVDFNLTRPSRIVVDVYGVEPVTGKKVYPVAFGGVSRVRVGEHMEKTRIVIDLAGRLPAYDVNKNLIRNRGHRQKKIQVRSR